MSEKFDNFDDLREALKRATPSPDGAQRAKNIALAMKNFDSLQGSEPEARQTSDHPKTGIFRGMKNMFAQISMRSLALGSTALAAFGLIMVLPVLQNNGSGLPDFLTRSESTMSQPEPVSSDRRLSFGSNTTSVESTADAKSDLFSAPAKPAPTAKRGTRQNGGLLTLNSLQSDPAYSASPQGTMIAEPAADTYAQAPGNTEAFPDDAPGNLKVTSEDPVSAFSIDVDTASYGIVRDSLMNGLLPNPDAVRIEEMVNYFPYDYTTIPGGQPFSTTVSVSQTPWNPGSQLVHIALQGDDVTKRVPLNLVFLIDTSGSMNRPDKLPLLRQSFRLLLGQLNADDQVSIVTYAGSAGEVLAPTRAEERDVILAALDRLDAGGGTAGQAGLEQAYATAQKMGGEGEVTRVILATDGDFNVGISDPDGLEAYIGKQRDSGVYLNVLGFGRGNLDDATMQALAQAGNGQAVYIDTFSEAQKALVDQLNGAMFPIADDVKIQVEFNPSQIAEYRLIGYESRILNRDDFKNDNVDAGEIGAGHQVTAMYEVVPVGSDARLTEPLRYGDTAEPGGSDELGFLRLRYKAPGEDVSQLIETPILASSGPLSADAQFGTAIAGFGQLLRGSDYVTDWNMGDAISLATEARGSDPFGYRQEAIQLMRLAQSLSE